MTALVSLERFEALLRKEKDGASRPDHFWADSLNAFIPRFCGSEGVFVFILIFILILVLAAKFEDEDEDENEGKFHFRAGLPNKKPSA